MIKPSMLRAPVIGLLCASLGLAVQAQPMPLLHPVPPPAKLPQRKTSTRIAAAAVPLSLREQEIGILNVRQAEPLLRNSYLKLTHKSAESAGSYLQWLLDWRYPDRGSFPLGVKGIVLHFTAGHHVFGALDALKSRNNCVHYIITEEMALPDGSSDSLILKLMDLSHIPRAAAFPDILTFNYGGRAYEKYDGAFIDIEVTAGDYNEIISHPKRYHRLLQLLDYLVDYLGLWEPIEGSDPADPQEFQRITQVLTGHGVIAQEYIATMLKLKRPDLADYPRSDFTAPQVQRVVTDLVAYRHSQDQREEGLQCPTDYFLRTSTEAP